MTLKGRKYSLAVFFGITDFILAVMQIDAAIFGVYVGAQATIMSTYGYANVMDKKNGGEG